MRTRFTIALLVALALPVRAADIGDDFERGMGRMVADEIRASYGVVDDPLLDGWVDRLGQRLAKVSGRTNVKYEFTVLNSDEVNAEAAPGGFIFVNRGTLRFVRSEDELASVLGHEVGHVAGRHAMKQLTAQLIGTLALAGFHAMHAETLRTVGSLAGGLAMLKYSRDEENDADRRGLRNAIATGYDGEAMIGFFRHLAATEREKPDRFEAYFLTHPPLEERVKRIGKEPGAQLTAANLQQLAQGYADRALYREAAAIYRRALALDPGRAELKTAMSEAMRRAPRLDPGRALAVAACEEPGRKLDSLIAQMAEADARIADERQRLDREQKGTDEELSAAARSLTDASMLVSNHDQAALKQFLRMARAFDRAVRVGTELRSARDGVSDSMSEMTRLLRSAREAVAHGDADAAAQVQPLADAAHSLMGDLSAGIKLARERAGSAKEGARELRQSADSLMSRFRSAFGYTEGQYGILDLQVTTAQDSLNGALDAVRRASARVARGRMTLLASRIDFATRSVRPDDAATAAIAAHYLGGEPAAISALRPRLSLSAAALAVADDRTRAAYAARKEGRKKPAWERERDPLVRDGMKWENASVLFSLMANDLERETAGQ